MKRNAFISGSLALVWIASSACSPQQAAADDVRVALAFDPTPYVGPVECTIDLTGPGGQAMRGAKVEVEANMNHAGMVPVFGTGQEVADGRYEVPLEFTMGGDWFVIVRGSLEDGTPFESIHDLPGVSAQTAPHKSK